jgi:hypothetical protein
MQTRYEEGACPVRRRCLPGTKKVLDVGRYYIPLFQLIFEMVSYPPVCIVVTCEFPDFFVAPPGVKHCFTSVLACFVEIENRCQLLFTHQSL